VAAPESIIRPPPKRHRKKHAGNVGWVRDVWQWRGLLPCVLLLIAAVSFWPDRQIAADDVNSDSPDYVIPCLNFVEGKGMILLVNGTTFPPYHTVGFSLLMTPFYLFLGKHPGNGVYLVFLCGLATMMLLYLIGKRVFGVATAFVACLCLCSAEAFRVFSKTIWADVPSACLCLAVYLLVLVILDKARSSLGLWFALGQTIGYAIFVRPDNGVILLPVCALFALQMRTQERIPQKILLAASGLVLWGIVMLLTNVVYTGDVFRSQVQVTTSGLFDRPDRGFSWRFLFKSPRPDYPFGQLLRAARYQWSLVDSTVPFKRIFFYCADLFFAIGLIQSIRLARRDRMVRHFLLWTVLWVVLCVLFVGCSLLVFDDRYMQRVVPYLCLCNGLGVVVAWKLVLRLSEPLRKAFRAISAGAHLRLWSYAIALQLRSLLVISLLAGWLWMISHPYVIADAWLPTVAYLKHAASLIPENDAIVISNFESMYSAYFFGLSEHWLMLPLDRTTATDQYIQWRKPPHPEWIVEDFTSDDWFPYKRMFENGAQYIFPQTSLDNPEIVDSAMDSGRVVYVACAGVYTDPGLQALANLANRYAIRVIELGLLPDSSGWPQQSVEAAKHGFFGQLVPKGSNLGTRLSIETTGGAVQFEP
jgi:hypothetical protein